MKDPYFNIFYNQKTLITIATFIDPSPSTLVKKGSKVLSLIQTYDRVPIFFSTRLEGKNASYYLPDYAWISLTESDNQKAGEAAIK